MLSLKTLLDQFLKASFLCLDNNLVKQNIANLMLIVNEAVAIENGTAQRNKDAKVNHLLQDIKM